MKQIRLWLRRYFRFSQRETNGFLILLLITLVAIITPFLINTNPEPYHPAQEQARLDSLIANLDTLAAAERYTYRNKYSEAGAKSEINLHQFNPNTAGLAELQQVGLNKFAANNILKYRAKAGDFTHKEQLQRIYGITPEKYRQLEPYIDLPSRSGNYSKLPEREFANTYPGRNNYPNKKYTREPYRLAAFDLNTADTTQLKRIRGIGSKLSARIVKFRDKLGGFATPEQLTEVYGLPPEIVDSLQKYTFIPAGYQPQQLNVNEATYDELRAHPYVGFNLARLIIAYRTQHGPFKSLDDLRKIKLLDEARYQKLKPYVHL